MHAAERVGVDRQILAVGELVGLGRLIPYLFLSAAAAVRNRPLVIAALLASIALSLVNRTGWLYPDFTADYPNNTSMGERSLEYRDMLAVQLALSKKEEEIGAEHSFVHFLPDHFYTSYPELTYVAASPPGSKLYSSIFRMGRPRLDELGPCFFMPSPKLPKDAQAIEWLVREARRRDDYAVERVYRVTRGRYSGYVLRFRRRGVPCGDRTLRERMARLAPHHLPEKRTVGVAEQLVAGAVRRGTRFEEAGEDKTGEQQEHHENHAEGQHPLPG